MPPRIANRRHSAAIGRINCQREPPSAPRIANSRLRETARANSKFARFEQAISSTKLDKQSKRKTIFRPKSLMRDESNGAAFNPLAAFSFGKSLANLSPSAVKREAVAGAPRVGGSTSGARCDAHCRRAAYLFVPHWSTRARTAPTS